MPEGVPPKIREARAWPSRSSSARSLTSTSARWGTSTTARPRSPRPSPRSCRKRTPTSSFTSVRPDRQGAGGEAAGHHHPDRPRRVRDRQAALRPRRHAGPRRLHQEHDHRRRPGRRRHPGGLRRRRPHAPDPRARAARPPGGRALDRGGPEQGRHGRRRGAPRPRRARGAGAAHLLRLPRRRHPGHPGERPEGPRGRRRVDGEDPRAHGGGRRLHPRARARRSTSRS